VEPTQARSASRPGEIEQRHDEAAMVVLRDGADFQRSHVRLKVVGDGGLDLALEGVSEAPEQAADVLQVEGGHSPGNPGLGELRHGFGNGDVRECRFDGALVKSSGLDDRVVPENLERLCKLACGDVETDARGSECLGCRHEYLPLSAGELEGFKVALCEHRGVGACLLRAASRSVKFSRTRPAEPTQATVKSSRPRFNWR